MGRGAMRDFLNLKECIARGDYVWEPMEEQGVRVLRHVTFCQSPFANRYQSMNICAPLDYASSDGSIDANARVNGFSPADAPIIFCSSYSG